MTTQQILDKASITAFEYDMHGYQIPEITEILNSNLNEELYDNYNGLNPHFTEAMVQTLLDYENIRYMMESSRIDKSKPLTLAEATRDE